MINTWDLLKLLADSTRLRIIRVILQEEVSVAELQEILEMGQSRISSHLALLRQGELVEDRREGKRTYYSVNPRLKDQALILIKTAAESASGQAEVQADEVALKRILDKRRRKTEQYFNEVAERLGKNYCPGRSWEAIGHFLFLLTPEIDVADLGAGEGVLAQLLARRAKNVFCVDYSRKMVEVGKELAKKNGFTNLTYKLGDIEAVPLDDASVDLALLSQALHHAIRPRNAIREACRILRPGGRVVILDLKQHDFEKARELYADHWLGFSENFLYDLLTAEGFAKVEVQIVAKESKPPHFETILATGIKK